MPDDKTPPTSSSQLAEHFPGTRKSVSESAAVSTMPAGADQTNDAGEGETEDLWSTYDVLLADWSQHEASLSRWKQGDLVQDIPLTWITAPAEDPVTGVVNNSDAARPISDSSLKVTAIICTQTCDLGATSPGDAHPFVLLAPLIHESSLPSGAAVKLALTGKSGYLVQTLPPPDSGTRDGSEVDAQPTGASPSTEQSSPPRPARRKAWFADLRLIFPISKALLLSREPAHGFADERASLTFAETLAQKFRRAALNEVLSEALPQALKKFVQENGHRKQAFAKVEQVRLVILGGERLFPTRATLFVLTDGMELNEEERVPWTRFQESTESLFSGHGITLGPMLHADVSRLSATKYRQSVPVRCDLLGSVHWP